jgi:phosphoenolpyruvate synthase/pyruvate phosphate dikinase
MDGFPVTIRMLDPPLHEFLPQEGPALKKLCEQLAKELNTDTETVTRRLEGLHECNPMMVRRGDGRGAAAGACMYSWCGSCKQLQQQCRFVCLSMRTVSQ